MPSKINLAQPQLLSFPNVSSPISNTDKSLVNSYNFNILNAEEEKKLLSSEANFNDSDLLNSEMKSLRTPKELEGSANKFNNENKTLFNKEELDYINKSIEYESLVHQNIIETEKKSEIKILEKFNEKKEEKLKKLDPKVLLDKKHKTNNSQIKSSIIKSKMLRNSHNSNSFLDTSTNSVIYKQKTGLEKKGNSLTNKTTIASRTSTPNNNNTKISYDGASNKDNKKLNGRKAAFSSASACVSLCVTMSNNKNNTPQNKLFVSNNKNMTNKSKKTSIKSPIKNLNFADNHILTDLEEIFGENLENFDEERNFIII
jgi:hypothetical protein